MSSALEAWQLANTLMVHQTQAAMHSATTCHSAQLPPLVAPWGTHAKLCQHLTQASQADGLPASLLPWRASLTHPASIPPPASSLHCGAPCCRTPLLAALVSNILNLGLDFFFMFRLGWGVAGAALATSASQYLALGVMLYMLVRKGMLQPRDLRQVPGWREVLPLLRVSPAGSLT